MNRSEVLLRDLAKSSKVIEIGPSYNPLAAKRNGWNVFIVDHDNRDRLVAKYAANPTVDTSRIEDVDYVWRGGSVLEVIPTAEHGTFDAFIASHVIEHTTDVIAFLKAAESLIRPDGVIILAVPDKRKCFDLFRPPSTTSSALVAHHERRTRHTAATQFDNAAFIANKDSDTGWTLDDMRQPRLASTLDGAAEHWELGSRLNYIDAHHWIFVPASLQLMVLELSELGYLDLRVETCLENPSTEFYAWLRRGKEGLSPDEMQARRLDLLSRQIIELAEQTRQIPDSPLANALSRLAEAERRLADTASRTMHLDREIAALRRRPLDRILSWIKGRFDF